MFQKISGGFYHRVLVARHVFLRERHADVGFYAELDLLHVGVVHRAGREAHRPSVGQFGREGQSGAAARAVAHDGDEGTFPHVAHEGVGGTVARTVGEHHGPLLPAHAVRRFQIFGFGSGEVVVPRPGLVGDVSHQPFLVGEACGQPFGIGQRPARIVAHVHDEAVAQAQVVHHFVEVAVADGGRKATIIYITDIVVQNLVINAGGDAVVGAEVGAVQAVAEVGRIVLVPAPVASHVGGGVEVDMPVAQFGEHVAKHFEELCVGHAVVDERPVFGIDFVPREATFLFFVVVETILGVDDAPKRFEVVGGRVVGILFPDAAGARESQQEGVEAKEV